MSATRDVNEIQIFQLGFNYSYSNVNAGNSIFVCKSANALIVDDV